MTRQLHPELRSWLLDKLAANQFFAKAVGRKDARQIMQLAAHALVGTREEGGNNKGRIVELLQETLGGAGQEPWCMSMTQSCIAFAEDQTGIVSPVAASEHCLTVWNETPTSQRVKVSPLPGAIIIWRHGSTTNGHTGIVVGNCVNRTFAAVEGNAEGGTANGKVVRDGGGVYYTTRNQDGNGSMKVVGFLRPFA